MLARKRKNKKTGKWQVGIGNNKKEFETEKELDDYRLEEKLKATMPFSQKMPDGKTVYALSLIHI